MTGDPREFYIVIIGGLVFAGIMIIFGLVIIVVALRNRITLNKAVVLIYNKIKYGKERQNGKHTGDGNNF